MAPEAPHTLFASDNAAGVHPAVLEALVAANQGHALAYGADAWTARATAQFRDLLGVDAEVVFTWGGTGANVVGLQCLLAPWQAVICPASAHIAVDECGAPERFTGCKLIDVPTEDGKLRPEQVERELHGVGDEHHVQPRVVSITQSTEMGTLYSPAEIAALADVAHANSLLLHVDGARIGNAVAALDEDLRRVIVDPGVDVLTFGGTKNGLMYGEAVVFVDPALGVNAHFVRKQAAQLPSKMRFVAAQFEALLSDDLWLRNARHANAMAALLAERIAPIDGVELLHPPQVNAVFARVPAAALAPLADWSFFWVWDQEQSVVRWMCSFDTTEADVERFAAGVAEIVAAHR
ncbi:MAG: Low-specificity L-threonine aldolase [Acidimicrobiales bacterium]|nr:Low-specificity L-threonine aldolase [Acidimicrobiales bacterium]